MCEVHFEGVSLVYPLDLMHLVAIRAAAIIIEFYEVSQQSLQVGTVSSLYTVWYMIFGGTGHLVAHDT